MTVAALAAILASVSASMSLPPGLLQAVCATESGLRPEIIHHDDGSEDSIGLCQVQLSTARDLGFKGASSELLSPAVNAGLAGRYLRHQLDRYQGNVAKAVSAYNLGTYRGNAQGIPINKKYVHRVFSAWKAEQ